MTVSHSSPISFAYGEFAYRIRADHLASPRAIPSLHPVISLTTSGTTRPSQNHAGIMPPQGGACPVVSLMDHGGVQARKPFRVGAHPADRGLRYGPPKSA